MELSTSVDYVNRPIFVQFIIILHRKWKHTHIIFRWQDHKVHSFPVVSAQTKFLLSLTQDTAHAW